jgi:hypothetical protein
MALVLVCASARSAAADQLTAFTALLNGAQENPSVASPSQGMAFMTFNKDNSNLCYAISFSPLQGNEILAHFHGPAAPGQNAPVLHDISPSPSPFGSPKRGCVTITKDEAKLLKKGLFYINIHSSTATGGEIRGQVLPEKAKYKAPAIGSVSGAFLD